MTRVERRSGPAADSDGGRKVAALATHMKTGDDYARESAQGAFDPSAMSCAGAKAVALAPPPSGIGFIDRAAAPVQRAVRTAGGAAKIDEAPYAVQGAKAAAGTLFPVKDLIADNVQRTFTDVTEMETYADGGTDYIGDVKTASAGTYWYRLPKDQLMVLGEKHQDKAGNVEDVIVGLRTSRFMYEPFAELVSVDALNIPFTSTKARMAAANSGRKAAAFAGKGVFDPALENIVIKVLTGASIVRNEFVAGNPTQMDPTAVEKWGSRKKDRYSYGERAA
ncbi:MAG: hypothetical protein JWM26_3294, partial [Betaproteobacteria bacterium]|nr:hypothetical protein [Betaproteobacteria bacterium]